VDDRERALEIERLLPRLAELKTKRSALLSEAQDFAGMIHDIRAAFGNPYFYSGANDGPPRNADESVANYTGFNSHDVVAPTVRDLKRVDRELRKIRERLHGLGVTTT
jgi:hypothetical protein